MDKNIAAGEISGQGWQKMYFGLVKEKAELRELYEKDIVGFFAGLHGFLGMELPESREEQEVFGRLTAAVETDTGSFEARNDILCLANEYGIAAEESGFRRGFRTAMRLCMGRLNGGAVL